MTKLIDRIKLIVSKNDPNSINLLQVDNNKVTENSYKALIDYWESVNKNEKEPDNVYNEYKKIIDFSNKTESENKCSNVGLFSLFYFKGAINFLSIGSFENEIFYMELKCKEYEKVLSNAMEHNNELFVLTYWIL